MGIGRKLQNNPRLLEKAYQLTHRLVEKADPLIAKIGYERFDRWTRRPEEWTKKAIFDCKMCGQCVLSSTGMACPMNCPKQLRNGPCGGVRPGGYCEVEPDMACVWVEAFKGSQKMSSGVSIQLVQFPVDRRLEGHSSWLRAARLKAEELNAEKVNSNLERSL